MKILLAVDGSTCSEVAVNEVARRPWPGGTQLKIISVVEPPPITAIPDTWGPPSDYYDLLEQAGKNRASVAIEKALTRLRSGVGPKLQPTTEVITGLPKEVILQEADRWEADLVVLGSHGYRNLKRLWLGSVSRAVALHAKCSVEIVRDRAALAL